MSVIKDKFMQVFKSNKGASNVEIIVWVSVVLILATVLFAFGGTIGNWIKSAGNTVAGFKQG